MQSKNSKCSCQSGKNYKNCCMGKVFTSGEPLLYNYKKMPESPAFKGMPTASNDNEPDLATYLTLKINQFKLHEIFWGKAIKDEKLTQQDFRQYEFELHKEGNNWGILLLIVKGKENHFTHQDCFTYSGKDKDWQIIPIKYSTLSQMTKEEQSIIWLDFD